MRRINILCGLMSVLVFAYSCNNSVSNNVEKKEVTVKKVLQANDGSISLKVDYADCYSDKANPSLNTAEWDVLVSKSGRYDVWLLSATKDTTNLRYMNPVILNFRDNHIERKPVCDKIVLNSKEVELPYFRADSFIGSLFIQDTGLYSVELISEKIFPGDKSGITAKDEDSKFLSLFLTPVSN
jgi:hypothetical protein